MGLARDGEERGRKRGCGESGARRGGVVHVMCGAVSRLLGDGVCVCGFCPTFLVSNQDVAHVR